MTCAAMSTELGQEWRRLVELSVLLESGAHKERHCRFWDDCSMVGAGCMDNMNVMVHPAGDHAHRHVSAMRVLQMLGVPRVSSPHTLSSSGAETDAHTHHESMRRAVHTIIGLLSEAGAPMSSYLDVQASKSLFEGVERSEGETEQRIADTVLHDCATLAVKVRSMRNNGAIYAAAAGQTVERAYAKRTTLLFSLLGGSGNEPLASRSAEESAGVEEDAACPNYRLWEGQLRRALVICARRVQDRQQKLAAALREVGEALRQGVSAAQWSASTKWATLVHMTDHIVYTNQRDLLLGIFGVLNQIFSSVDGGGAGACPVFSIPARCTYIKNDGRGARAQPGAPTSTAVLEGVAAAAATAGELDVQIPDSRFGDALLMLLRDDVLQCIMPKLTLAEMLHVPAPTPDGDPAAALRAAQARKTPVERVRDDHAVRAVMEQLCLSVVRESQEMNRLVVLLREHLESVMGDTPSQTGSTTDEHGSKKQLGASAGTDAQSPVQIFLSQRYLSATGVVELDVSEVCAVLEAKARMRVLDWGQAGVSKHVTPVSTASSLVDPILAAAAPMAFIIDPGVDVASLLSDAGIPGGGELSDTLQSDLQQVRAKHRLSSKYNTGLNPAKHVVKLIEEMDRSRLKPAEPKKTADLIAVALFDEMRRTTESIASWRPSPVPPPQHEQEQTSETAQPATAGASSLSGHSAVELPWAPKNPSLFDSVLNASTRPPVPTRQSNAPTSAPKQAPAQWAFGGAVAAAPAARTSSGDAAAKWQSSSSARVQGTTREEASAQRGGAAPTQASRELNLDTTASSCARGDTTDTRPQPSTETASQDAAGVTAEVTKATTAKPAGSTTTMARQEIGEGEDARRAEHSTASRGAPAHAHASASRRATDGASTRSSATDPSAPPVTTVSANTSAVNQVNKNDVHDTNEAQEEEVFVPRSDPDYPFLSPEPCPGIYLDDVDYANNPRFRAAVNRMIAKRNSPGVKDKCTVLEEQKNINHIVVSLATALREATFQVRTAMPFLDCRVNGVLLGTLLPRLEENRRFMSLLSLRQQIIRGASASADGNQARLTSVDKFLHERACILADSIAISSSASQSLSLSLPRHDALREARATAKLNAEYAKYMQARAATLAQEESTRQVQDESPEERTWVAGAAKTQQVPTIEVETKDSINDTAVPQSLSTIADMNNATNTNTIGAEGVAAREHTSAHAHTGSSKVTAATLASGTAAPRPSLPTPPLDKAQTQQMKRSAQICPSGSAPLMTAPKATRAAASPDDQNKTVEDNFTSKQQLGSPNGSPTHSISSISSSSACSSKKGLSEQQKPSSPHTKPLPSARPQRAAKGTRAGDPGAAAAAPLAAQGDGAVSVPLAPHTHHTRPPMCHSLHKKPPLKSSRVYCGSTSVPSNLSAHVLCHTSSPMSDMQENSSYIRRLSTHSSDKLHSSTPHVTAVPAMAHGPRSSGGQGDAHGTAAAAKTCAEGYSLPPSKESCARINESTNRSTAEQVHTNNNDNNNKQQTPNEHRVIVRNGPHMHDTARHAPMPSEQPHRSTMTDAHSITHTNSPAGGVAANCLTNTNTKATHQKQASFSGSGRQSSRSSSSAAEHVIEEWLSQLPAISPATKVMTLSDPAPPLCSTGIAAAIGRTEDATHTESSTLPHAATPIQTQTHTHTHTHIQTHAHNRLPSAPAHLSNQPSASSLQQPTPPPAVHDLPNEDAREPYSLPAAPVPDTTHSAASARRALQPASREEVTSTVKDELPLVPHETRRVRNTPTTTTTAMNTTTNPITTEPAGGGEAPRMTAAHNTHMYETHESTAPTTELMQTDSGPQTDARAAAHTNFSSDSAGAMPHKDSSDVSAKKEEQETRRRRSLLPCTETDAASLSSSSALVSASALGETTEEARWTYTSGTRVMTATMGYGKKHYFSNYRSSRVGTADSVHTSTTHTNTNAAENTTAVSARSRSPVMYYARVRPVQSAECVSGAAAPTTGARRPGAAERVAGGAGAAIQLRVNIAARSETGNTLAAGENSAANVQQQQQQSLQTLQQQQQQQQTNAVRYPFNKEDTRMSRTANVARSQPRAVSPSATSSAAAHARAPAAGASAAAHLSCATTPVTLPTHAESTASLLLTRHVRSLYRNLLEEQDAQCQKLAQFSVSPPPQQQQQQNRPASHAATTNAHANANAHANENEVSLSGSVFKSKYEYLRSAMPYSRAASACRFHESATTEPPPATAASMREDADTASNLSEENQSAASAYALQRPSSMQRGSVDHATSWNMSIGGSMRDAASSCTGTDKRYVHTNHAHPDRNGAFTGSASSNNNHNRDSFGAFTGAPAEHVPALLIRRTSWRYRPDTGLSPRSYACSTASPTAPLRECNSAMPVSSPSFSSSARGLATLRRSSGVRLTAVAELPVDTPLQEVYRVACGACSIRPNSQLLSVFPSSKGAWLPQLDLSINYVGSKGLRPILSVLERNGSHLEMLNLSNNNLENEEVLELVSLLEKSEAGARLTVLDMSYNPISQTGGQALLRLRTSRKNITCIRVKGTLISPRLMQSIEDRPGGGGGSASPRR